MYGIVRFPYNGKIDEAFIHRFFEPCPKVGGICRSNEGALVIFTCPEDELLCELEAFLRPGGLFDASWGDLVHTIEPAEWKEAIDGRVTKLLSKRYEAPPCGSGCRTCPQYKSNCRGCPVTPFYLGKSYPLAAR